MAITDHTEASRPSSRKKSQPTPALRPTRHRKGTVEERQQRRAVVIAGIATTHQAIARLLDDAYAYRETHRHGANDHSYQNDALVKTVHGLFTATYFLNQYAMTLLRQPMD